MEPSPLAGLLMTLNRLANSNRMTGQEKGAIKDLALSGDTRVFAAHQSFIQNGDDADLVDTWSRILSNSPSPSPPVPEASILPEPGLLAVARQQWLPFYRYVQQERTAADPSAALERVEQRARLELGRLVFASQTLGLSSSDGTNVGGTEEVSNEKQDELDRDLASLSLQDLCIKYGGQGRPSKLLARSQISAQVSAVDADDDRARPGRRGHMH